MLNLRYRVWCDENRCFGEWRVETVPLDVDRGDSHPCDVAEHLNRLHEEHLEELDRYSGPVLQWERSHAAGDSGSGMAWFTAGPDHNSVIQWEKA